MATDPVCDVELDEQSAFSTCTYQHRPYFFCSAFCKGQFEHQPWRFAVRLALQSRRHEPASSPSTR